MAGRAVTQALTTATLLYGTYHLLRWWFTPSEDELLAQAALEAMDEFEEDEMDGARKMSDHPIIVLDAVAETRLKFGLLKDTRANRLIVFSFIRDYYNDKKDMRRCDKNKFTPLAVEMAFLPSASDIMAYRLRKTSAFTKRAQAVTTLGQ